MVASSRRRTRRDPGLHPSRLIPCCFGLVEPLRHNELARLDGLGPTSPLGPDCIRSGRLGFIALVMLRRRMHSSSGSRRGSRMHFPLNVAH